VQDPGNAGTVIRTADAAGADAVVFTAGSVDVWNGKCVRASAGSVFHLPIVTGMNLDELVPALRTLGCRVLATSGAAQRTLDSVLATGELTEPTAWIFGNEAHGLPHELLEAADLQVRVPILGRAESLNLAGAATVCLYASAWAHVAKAQFGDAPQVVHGEEAR
jgi:TrmH family RNA methyltransferase